MDQIIVDSQLPSNSVICNLHFQELLFCMHLTYFIVIHCLHFISNIQDRHGVSLLWRSLFLEYGAKMKMIIFGDIGSKLKLPIIDIFTVTYFTNFLSSQSRFDTYLVFIKRNILCIFKSNFCNFFPNISMYLIFHRFYRQ